MMKIGFFFKHILLTLFQISVHATARNDIRSFLRMPV